MVLRILYVIEGTPFENEMFVIDYDENLFEEDMLFLENREDVVRKKVGDLTVSSNMAFGSNEPEMEELPDGMKDISEIPVTANSALSEYLAINILAGV